jgi:hypothetical protein
MKLPGEVSVLRLQVGKFTSKLLKLEITLLAEEL